MDLETQTHPHPNPQPNPHHRKIDLQSPRDLTYLQTNLAQSALQKLDLHFPKISKPATHITLGGTSTPTTTRTTQAEAEEEEERDPMRRRVHELVSQFLRDTWHSAAPNIAVNGIDASSLPVPGSAMLTAGASDEQRVVAKDVEGIHFRYEAFDAGLQRRLAGLYGEVEMLTAQVARLRREAPGKGEVVWRERVEEVLMGDEGLFNGLEGVEGEVMEVDGVREGWNEGVSEMYGIGVKQLAGLAGQSGAGEMGPTLTETVGRAQRARRVAMELE